MTEPCMCGHAPEEHLDTTLGPGACDAGDCDCVCYEPDLDAIDAANEDDER